MKWYYSLDPSTRREPSLPFPKFDRSQLKIRPLAEREHDLNLDIILELDAPSTFDNQALPGLAAALIDAKQKNRARILMMGAHVLRAGVQKHIVDLIDKGLISHIAMNGAGPIHDYEMALIGATTESVAKYIRTGEFGLWRETAQINDAVVAGRAKGMGMGESIGRAILDGKFPYKDLSILAQALKRNIPVTVHIGIGYDIIHEHPNCDGAALGGASYDDFLIFTEAVRNLEGGVLLSFGSAVMGPEVYLKALSMARNVALQKGETIAKFTTGVFDLVPIEGDHRQQAPKTDPKYYYRPWKTILVRTVVDGGVSNYIAGDHRDTLPALRREAIRLMGAAQ
jgi:hypothetical protein